MSEYTDKLEAEGYVKQPISDSEAHGRRICFCGHAKDEHSYAGCHHLPACTCVYFAPVTPHIDTYSSPDGITEN